LAVFTLRASRFGRICCVPGHSAEGDYGLMSRALHLRPTRLVKYPG